MSRRIFFAMTAMCAVIASYALPASAAEPPRLTVGFGNFIVGYLPLPLAESLGFFREEGVVVEIQNFNGPGSKALQSVIGGTSDFGFGGYDHTLHMQVQGKDLECVALINRLPGLAIVARKDLSDRIRSLRDVKGATIGIPGPGTLTEFMLRQFISDAGLSSTDDVSIVSVGGQESAIAALKTRRVDVEVGYDPSITLLHREGLADVILDLRTVEQTHAALGGDYPWTCLYARRATVEQNPEATQKLVNGIVRALRWIDAHSPKEITDQTRPEYQIGGRDLFIDVLTASKPMFPTDAHLTEDMMARSRKFVATFVPQIRTFPIRLEDTYTNRFVDAAPAVQ